MIKRRLIDGKIVAKVRYFPISRMLVMMFAGLIFGGAGLYLGIDFVKDRVAGDSQLPLVVEIISFLLFFGVGVAAFIDGILLACRADKLRKTRKYGNESIAKIIGHDFAYFGGGGHNGEGSLNRFNRRFRFTLEYTDKSGVEKVFKTGYYYDLNEFNHLQSLENLKVKVYKKSLFIDEEFPIEIYVVDSVHELSLKRTVESERYFNIRKGTAISSLLASAAFALNTVVAALTHKIGIFIFGILILVIGTVPWGFVYTRHFFTREEDEDIDIEEEDEDIKQNESEDGHDEL